MRLARNTKASRSRTRHTSGRGAAMRRGLKGPVLIAGISDAALVGALRFAEGLARRERVNAHVLGVIRPVSGPVWLPAHVDPETLEAGRKVMQLEALRRRVHQTVGRSVLFSIEVAAGHPARVLAASARARQSAYIVAGLPGRNAAARRESEDELLEITRATDRPVIAVPHDHAVLPTRALVAVDFGESSRRAALVARQLLGHDARMTLMHVAAESELAVAEQARLAPVYERSARQLLRDLADEMTQAGGVSVGTVFGTGDPADELLSHLRSGGFDLVACGTQGAAAREQFFTGSVSAALLRRARCAVLLTPPIALDQHARRAVTERSTRVRGGNDGRSDEG